MLSENPHSPFEVVYNQCISKFREAGLSSSQISVLFALEKWKTFLSASHEEQVKTNLVFLNEFDLSNQEEYQNLLGDREKTKDFAIKLDTITKKLQQHIIAQNASDPTSSYRSSRDPVSRELVDDINKILDKTKTRIPAQFTNLLIDLIHYESRAIAVKFGHEIQNSGLDTSYHGRISRVSRKEESGNRANIEISNALPYLRTLFNLTQLCVAGKIKVISIDCEAPKGKEDDVPSPTAYNFIVNPKARFESLLNGLYAAHDLFHANKDKRFILAEIPLLPPLQLDGLKDQQAITKAVLNWLFFGEPIGKIGESLLDPKKFIPKGERKPDKKDTQASEDLNEETSQFKTLNDWIEEASLQPAIKTLRAKVKESLQLKAQMVLYNHTKSSSAYWKLASKALLIASSRASSDEHKGCVYLDNAVHILDANAGAISSPELDGISNEKVARSLHHMSLDEEIFHVGIMTILPDILSQDEDDDYENEESFIGATKSLIANLHEISNPFEIGDVKLFYALTKTRFDVKIPTKQQILQYYFESIPFFHEEFLEEFFEQLPSLEVNELPEIFWSRLRVETGASEEAVDGIKRVVAKYTPIDNYALPEFTLNLSNPLRLLSGSPLETMGVSDEAKNILHALNTNGGRTLPGIVVVKDDSRYEYLQTNSIPSADVSNDTRREERKESFAYRVRIVERLARDVMMVTQEGVNSRTILASVPENSERIPPHLGFAVDLLNGKIELNSDSEKMSQRMLDLLVPTGQDVTLIIETSKISNASNYARLLKRISDIGIKCIIFTNDSIPSVKEISVTRFTESSLVDAIKSDKKMLQGYYDIKDFDDSALEYACTLVMKFTPPNHNPMEYLSELVHRCCEDAKSGAVITHPDVLEVASEMFRLPSPSTIEVTKRRLEKAKVAVKQKVLGQDEAIDEIFVQLEKQLTGQNEPGRPLSFLLAGPTGVGKTEFVEALAQELGLPYMKIPGSMYSESHSVSRFTGSPPGYAGADEGELFLFLKKNSECIFFVDEWEKMHPDVQLALMDVFDKGEITSGAGQTIKVPGLIGFGATNAGAGRITYGMPYEELKQLLGSELVRGKQYGATEVPELVARFHPVIFPGVTESAIGEIFKIRLAELVQRGFWAAKNVHVKNITEEALKIFVTEAKTRCSGQKEQSSLGFRKVSNQDSGPRDRYFDLRQIKHVITALTSSTLELEEAIRLQPRLRYDIEIATRNEDDGKVSIVFNILD